MLEGPHEGATSATFGPLADVADECAVSGATIIKVGLQLLVRNEIVCRVWGDLRHVGAASVGVARVVIFPRRRCQDTPPLVVSQEVLQAPETQGKISAFGNVLYPYPIKRYPDHDTRICTERYHFWKDSGTTIPVPVLEAKTRFGYFRAIVGVKHRPTESSETLPSSGIDSPHQTNLSCETMQHRNRVLLFGKPMSSPPKIAYKKKCVFPAVSLIK